MEFVSDRLRNPFDVSPPCERYVPGNGDPNADVHVIGDHPGCHGGLEERMPFTGRRWSGRFFETLAASGLVEVPDDDGDVAPIPRDAFLSYMHSCDPGEGAPAETDYARLEPFFDAELRAITAHVLVPVGARATRHVLAEYTAREDRAGEGVGDRHATEIRGSGWLVVPLAEPWTWDEGEAEAVVRRMRTILERDFRQTADLGRFAVGAEPYFVR